MFMRRYLINSIENMRDIGGYPVDNKKIKCGKIIRSNLPNKMTKNDLEYLKGIGIETVIDLRSEEEVKKKESNFEGNECFKLLHYKVNGDGKIPDTCQDVPISYMKMLEGNDTIYKIFKLLANEENGVLYFCNAGKDRTGVVSALILMTLGADKKDIIADYTLSNIYMRDILKKFEENSEDKKIKDIITPKMEYMEQFLDYFNEKYGAVDNYLNDIGITEEDVNKIRSKYIE